MLQPWSSSVSLPLPRAHLGLSLVSCYLLGACAWPTGQDTRDLWLSESSLSRPPFYAGPAPGRRSQQLQVLQVPLTFEDIVVHFTREEWHQLGPRQRRLYQEVMLENYNHLTSLGELGNGILGPLCSTAVGYPAHGHCSMNLKHAFPLECGSVNLGGEWGWVEPQNVSFSVLKLAPYLSSPKEYWQHSSTFLCPLYIIALESIRVFVGVWGHTLWCFGAITLLRSTPNCFCCSGLRSDPWWCA